MWSGRRRSNAGEEAHHRKSCHRRPPASQASMPSIHLRKKHFALSSHRTPHEVEQLTLSTNGQRQTSCRGDKNEQYRLNTPPPQISPPPSAPTTMPRTQVVRRTSTTKMWIKISATPPTWPWLDHWEIADVGERNTSPRPSSRAPTRRRESTSRGAKHTSCPGTTQRWTTTATYLPTTARTRPLIPLSPGGTS
jgi:hypothetical protein